MAHKITRVLTAITHVRDVNRLKDVLPAIHSNSESEILRLDFVSVLRATMMMGSINSVRNAGSTVKAAVMVVPASHVLLKELSMMFQDSANVILNTIKMEKNVSFAPLNAPAVLPTRSVQDVKNLEKSMIQLWAMVRVYVK